MLRSPAAKVEAGWAPPAPKVSENPSFLYPAPTASRTTPLGRVAMPPLALASTLRIVPKRCSLPARVVEGFVKKMILDFVSSSAASTTRVVFQSPGKLKFKPAAAAYLRSVDGDSVGAGKNEKFVNLSASRAMYNPSTNTAVVADRSCVADRVTELLLICGRREVGPSADDVNSRSRTSTAFCWLCS